MSKVAWQSFLIMAKLSVIFQKTCVIFWFTDLINGNIYSFRVSFPQSRMALVAPSLGINITVSSKNPQFPIWLESINLPSSPTLVRRILPNQPSPKKAGSSLLCSNLGFRDSCHGWTSMGTPSSTNDGSGPSTCNPARPFLFDAGQRSTTK